MVTVWIQGDPQKLEEYAGAHREEMQTIIGSAESHGLIAHRFYGSGGQIMVVDEWPDEQSFQSFFQENQGRIGPLMQAAGAQGEPGVNVWQKLDTGDEFGWGA